MATNKNDDKAVKHTMRLGENNLLKLTHHSDKLDDKNMDRNKKTITIKIYHQTTDDYGFFLKRFPKSPHIYKNTFQYTKILYSIVEDYDTALTQYQNVINQKPKNKHIKNTTLGIIYSSYEIMMKKSLRKASTRGKMQIKKISKKELRKQEKRKIERTDLHALEKTYINTADQYVNLLLNLRKNKK